MKSFLVIIFNFGIYTIMVGQTPEEILCRTEDTYRTFSNYVDRGQHTLEIYSEPKVTKSFNYFLALDRRNNVNHWTNGFEFGRTFGVLYTKTENDSLGTYTRLGTDDDSFQCSIHEAAGRLTATGGGILLMTGSLFYTDIYSDLPGDASNLQFYDNAIRHADTIIQDEKCFVIETKRTYQLSQKMADDQNRRRDSILSLHVLLIPFPPRLDTQAGPRTLILKYYIRISDGILIRREQFNYDARVLKSKTTLRMEPMHDVKEFEKYLQR